MTLDQALEKLRAFGDPAVREMNARKGASQEQFGARLGDIRKVAKEIKTDPELAAALWESGNLDAQLLALLIIKPKKLAAGDLDRMVRQIKFVQVADWFNAYLIKNHPAAEEVRARWMDDPNPWVARSGWSLTAGRVNRKPEGLHLTALLDRIEDQMADAPEEAQWTMNNTLAAIGIQFPEHRDRAIAIGESLGVFRDYPVSKGCTSPFAPIWIQAIADREG